MEIIDSLVVPNALIRKAPKPPGQEKVVDEISENNETSDGVGNNQDDIVNKSKESNPFWCVYCPSR